MAMNDGIVQSVDVAIEGWLQDVRNGGLRNRAQFPADRQRRPRPSAGRYETEIWIFRPLFARGWRGLPKAVSARFRLLKRGVAARANRRKSPCFPGEIA
jgi:hypothetical protein